MLWVRGGCDLRNGKSRAGLLAAAAGYLLYLSWQLFDHRGDTDTTMTPFVRWLFIAFFVIAAAAIGIYAFRVWKAGAKEEEQQMKNDENSLK